MPLRPIYPVPPPGVICPVPLPGAILPDPYPRKIQDAHAKNSRGKDHRRRLHGPGEEQGSQAHRQPGGSPVLQEMHHIQDDEQLEEQGDIVRFCPDTEVCGPYAA